MDFWEGKKRTIFVVVFCVEVLEAKLDMYYHMISDGLRGLSQKKLG